MKGYYIGLALLLIALIQYEVRCRQDIGIPDIWERYPVELALVMSGVIQLAAYAVARVEV